jgi:3-deoxy-D-manno-octulosonic-acid transferase
MQPTFSPTVRSAAVLRFPMLWLYRILFLPVLVVFSPYYLLRMRRRGGYRRHFGQRLGSVEGLPAKPVGVRRVWIQAVSVGEMLAIGPILEAFKQDRGVEFYLTTTTSTGYKIARERYQENTVAIGYFPIDFWGFSARAWRKIQPDIVILTEGERWPEHVSQAAARGVRVIALNARLSDRSFRRMRRWNWASRPLLRGITRVLASSELDAQRFRELGVPSEAVRVTGNIKLDLTLPPFSPDEMRMLRRELGLDDELILLGSSTWPGEELALVHTLRHIRQAGLKCRLLLAPRHAERRADIESMLKESGLSYHFRTRGSAEKKVDVCVADTTGELRRLTHLAHLVFVGKSLPPHDQGQTPVEAAALGKPLVFGPGMSNFRSIAQGLVKAGAAAEVRSANQLMEVGLALLRDEKQRETMAQAARSWHQANQGAVARTIAILREEFSEHRHPPTGDRAGRETTWKTETPADLLP